MLVLNTLAPVFLLIAVGAGLQKSAFVSPGFLREANRVTYWVGLPALLFSQLVDSLHQANGVQNLVGAAFLATGLVIAAAGLAGWALRVPGGSLGTFVQGAMRGNLAFVGLPIIFALPDAPVAGGLGLHGAAVLVVAPTMVLYNVAAVIVLVLSQHAFGLRMVVPMLRQLATTPPLLATLAGLGFVAADWTLPRVLAQTFGALGEMALPLGLLGVGGSLVSLRLGSAPMRPVAAALLKTAVAPALGWLVARGLGLGAGAAHLLAILLACPTAIVSYTMAVELKGDEQLASATIAWSVIFSVGTLAAILALG